MCYFFLQAVVLIIKFYWHLKIQKFLFAIGLFYCSMFFSCLFVSFFLNVAYFIVSFLTVPFISSHFVFRFVSLFISAISAMLCIS